MNVRRTLDRLVFFTLRELVPVFDTRACTRYLMSYYRRRGMKICGMPNWVSPRTWFDGTDYSLIELNEGCTISHHVRFLTHDWALYTVARGIGLDLNHPIGSLRGIRVGRFAFVGMGSMLLPGTDIGDAAIIGAGTIVRGKVPSYAIVVGNPGRQVGDTRDYIRRHLQRLGETDLVARAEVLLNAEMAK